MGCSSINRRLGRWKQLFKLPLMTNEFLEQR